MLHQGRFDAASAAFEEISRRSESDPTGPLFEALTTWWRLLDRPDDTGLHETFEKRLDEAIRRGEALLATGEIQRGRIFAGTAYLLAAQARAFSGSYLAAGRAARSGNALLEEAISADPEAADVQFALGAYKYFAARLPWLVRFLRVFVRLPGGDVQEGLQALDQAAREGKYFRAESLLLLAYIHSGDDDTDLRAALDEVTRARALGSDSPLLATLQARFLLQLGRLAEAESTAHGALKLSGSLAGVAPSIPALARLIEALSLYYQYQPEKALEALGPLQSDPGDLPPDSRKRFDGLVARIRSDLDVSPPGAGNGSSDGRETGDTDPPRHLAAAAPRPSGSRALEALGRLRDGQAKEAAGTLGALAAQDPNDVVLRYHAARAYQIAGEPERALVELHRLLETEDRIPKTLRGWALLRMGAALEACGRPEEAQEFYRRGARLKGFVFRSVGADTLKHPESPYPPEG
ncbi:MAG TPA: hypothetical protein VNI57_11145 [Candidatus Saccharimonadales bacterium]|nr:hypothetical protein [Candidatus Saccharimonadales bacterium]